MSFNSRFSKRKKTKIASLPSKQEKKYIKNKKKPLKRPLLMLEVKNRNFTLLYTLYTTGCDI